MTPGKHPNSKKVTIFRANSFMASAQGADTAGYLATTKRSVGAYWESKSSTRVASGLEHWEERLLLPSIIEVEAEDREFLKKRVQFYCDIDTPIEYEHGKTLEIGLEESNTSPVSKTNFPLNIMDYIRYRHIIKNPQVAMSKEDATGNSIKEFYVFDKSAVQAKSDLYLEEKDSAMKAYQEIANSPEKISQALTLLGISLVLPTGLMSTGEQKAELRQRAIDKPKAFLDMYNTKEFELNYWIKALINSKVIKILGEKYFESETDALLANSLEEMVWFLKDDQNSDRVTSLKAQYQEKSKLAA